jgi:hypothetical protein
LVIGSTNEGNEVESWTKLLHVGDGATGTEECHREVECARTARTASVRPLVVHKTINKPDVADQGQQNNRFSLPLRIELGWRCFAIVATHRSERTKKINLRRNT